MSNETNETIADIVREMRKRAEEVYEGQAGYPESWKDQMNDDEIREIADRIEAAHKREVAELRECLKEAIREKCPFTRMSCKKGEPCDYECGTDKWRMALGDEGGGDDSSV